MKIHAKVKPFSRLADQLLGGLFGCLAAEQLLAGGLFVNVKVRVFFFVKRSRQAGRQAGGKAVVRAREK